MKVTRTIYLEFEVYETAKRLYGERGVSAAIERLLESEQLRNFRCNVCHTEFFETVWRNIPRLKDKCISCGAALENLNVI